MKPFKVEVGEDVLADLQRRLDATRWPDEAPDAVPEHGLGLAAARELAAYWRDGYDWRAAEAVLNGFEQHVSDGVHFIAAGDGPPLLLLHGWPSSVWEFVRDHAAARCARDRALAARLRLLVHAGRGASVDRRVRRRAARADASRSGTSATTSRAATGAPASPSGSRTHIPTPCRRCTCT